MGRNQQYDLVLIIDNCIINDLINTHDFQRKGIIDVGY